MPRKTTLTPSPEIAAMAQIEAALLALSEQERNRVLRWLPDRFPTPLVRNLSIRAADLDLPRSGVSSIRMKLGDGERTEWLPTNGPDLTDFAGNCPGAEDISEATGDGEG